MSALHPQVLDPEQWRPASWQGTDDTVTIAEVDDFHKGHVRKGWVTKKGVIIEANDEKRIKGCPEAKRKGVEMIAHNYALLRDCWLTPVIVWQVVEAFFGRPIACDPWWNPWSATRPAVCLDGSLGCDGFAVDEHGAAKYWSGPVGANGPHSSTAHTPDVPEDSSEAYKPGGWLRMCSEYGKTEQCAAVLPARGDDCLIRYGMTADVVIDFNRLNFDAPPGIKATSNPGCTLVALWLPDRDCSKPARKLFKSGAYSALIPRPTKHKRTGLYAREIQVRRGVPAHAYDPKKPDPLGLFKWPETPKD